MKLNLIKHKTTQLPLGVTLIVDKLTLNIHKEEQLDIADVIFSVHVERANKTTRVFALFKYGVEILGKHHVLVSFS